MEGCSVSKCGRKAVIRKPRLCIMHYKRWRKWGDANIRYKRERNLGKCIIEGCIRDSYCREWCMRHYQAWKRYGNPLTYNRKRNIIKKEPYPRKDGREIHLSVMENTLGRKIIKGEVVHHIDLDKKNFTKENLYLCKNRREHNKCHNSLKEVGAELYGKGIIKFEYGKYFC